ncbi:MAG: lysophospholipid acyltransferase family protein [Myxococcaceae bacterium]
MSVTARRAAAASAAPFLPAGPLPLWEVLGRTRATLCAIVFEALRTARARGLTEEERFGHRALASHRVAGRLVELNGLRMTLSGELPKRPSVLVANHLSYWDPVLLGALLPMAAIAKSELASWPLLGRCGEALGTLYVQRGNVHHSARVLRQALRRLVAGVHVLNFPEGTTTDGTQVLAFRRGIFGVAARAGVPVVPVALRLWPNDAAWLGGEPFVPHYTRHWRRGGYVEASVRFGRPLQPRDFATPEACAAEARARVAALLGGQASRAKS